MRIGFDYDGVLDGNFAFGEFLKAIVTSLYNEDVFILTTRDSITSDMRERLNELGFSLEEDMIVAIGKMIDNRMFDSKAHYIHTMNIRCDLFFDNDPYEIDALRKYGINCIWVPEMDKESLMWEITQGFLETYGKE